MRKKKIKKARQDNWLIKGKLPPAQRCEICGFSIWCWHNFEKAKKQKK